MMTNRVASTIALLGLVIGIFPSTTMALGYNLPVCSATVHNNYKVVGPDGQMYASWHPQIDHYFNCHFDHEHGSNPALISPVTWTYGSSLVPAYGYVSAKAGSSEGHAGFKTYVFDLAGYTWMLSHHFGTANPQIAACERFHAVDLVIMDGQTKKVDIHFMGDYGAGIAIDNDGDLTPTACPTQAADARAAGSDGSREIPVGATATDYEPWRLDTRELTALGFRPGALVINTGDPQKACNALTCDSGVTKTFQGGAENNRGVRRFITFNHPTQGDFRISGTTTGTFYTDPTGMQTRTSGQPDAVRQYIAPGFSLTVGAQQHCNIVNGTGNDGPYWCSATVGSLEIIKLNRLVTGAN